MNQVNQSLTVSDGEIFMQVQVVIPSMNQVNQSWLFVFLMSHGGVVIPSMNQVNQSLVRDLHNEISAISRNPFNESGQSIVEMVELISPNIKVVIPSMNQVNQSS